MVNLRIERDFGLSVSVALYRGLAASFSPRVNQNSQYLTESYLPKKFKGGN